jgi:aspartyl-tRNA(Asn)/glutamyl-tRNA(Gln) amidotransferase subunit A
VRRLEGAGWANVGKTNLHEFAYGITSQNPHYGTVPNPVAPGRIAGGSSGGSAAAIASGEAEGALGSDTGGSIRIPAACCGVVGFKPTFGLVPVEGCFPLAPSFDHVGPIAGSVGVCAEMLEALAPEFERTALDSLDSLRVGVAWTEDADPLIGARVRKAAAHFADARAVAAPFADDLAPAFMGEVADTHRVLYGEHHDLYGKNVGAKVASCLAIGDEHVEAARRAREPYRATFADLFEQLDLLVTPTLARVPPPATIDELTLRGLYVRFTLPFNAIGAPALALPCGSAEEGLPASVQLVGAPGSDALVLAAGELLERALTR